MSDLQVQVKDQEWLSHKEAASLLGISPSGISKRTDIFYPQVWNMVHEMTGRRSVEDYIFEDYGVAIKYLKRVYEKNAIAW